jgi:hypothetical protein
MKFEDLTQWDIDHIKSMAKDEYINSNLNDINACLVKSVLSAVHAMGYNMVKDETRDATWTHGPKKSWYAQHEKKKW